MRNEVEFCNAEKDEGLKNWGVFEGNMRKMFKVSMVEERRVTPRWCTVKKNRDFALLVFILRTELIIATLGTLRI